MTEFFKSLDARLQDPECICNFKEAIKIDEELVKQNMEEYKLIEQIFPNLPYPDHTI